MFESLRNSEPLNGVYSMFIVQIKNMMGRDFSADIELFLNATQFQDFFMRARNVLNRQNTLGHNQFLISSTAFWFLPKPNYYGFHEIMKTQIPRLNLAQRSKLESISLMLVNQAIESSGRYSNLIFYGDNWLRRINSPHMLSFWFFSNPEYRAGTIWETRLWDNFANSVSSGKCDNSIVDSALLRERNWYALHR